MKIIFAGTPEFAVPTLTALLHSKHQVIAVYTQPDRAAGRGQKLTASAVKRAAENAGLPIFQPPTLRDEQEQQRLRELQADIMVVVAYGLLLPQAVLDAPRFGCLNVHASLLPRWRGAAPIQRAILAGDTETGVTIMQMEQGLDTGAMLLQTHCPIEAEDTSATLHEKLATLGAAALLDTVTMLEHGHLHPIPQDNALACYAKKIEKAEAKIDWHESAITIDRKIRAFNPWPTAFTAWNEQMLKVWQAKALSEKSTQPAGAIVKIDKSGIDVASGDGILRILRLQLPGGKPISVVDFLNAKPKLPASFF